MLYKVYMIHKKIKRFNFFSENYLLALKTSSNVTRCCFSTTLEPFVKLFRILTKWIPLVRHVLLHDLNGKSWEREFLTTFCNPLFRMLLTIVLHFWLYEFLKILILTTSNAVLALRSSSFIFVQMFSFH